MSENRRGTGLSRRGLLAVFGGGLAGIAGASLRGVAEEDKTATLVQRLTGKTPILSNRVRLMMPKVFPNGYTVPLAFDVDSDMTETDHVEYVRVLAPENPLVDVATFHFTPNRIRPRVATRIRLAKPQFIVALAAMNDGALLMAKTWVDVASNGCE